MCCADTDFGSAQLIGNAGVADGLCFAIYSIGESCGLDAVFTEEEYSLKVTVCQGLRDGFLPCLGCEKKGFTTEGPEGTESERRGSGG